jgi:hypothetical protein
MIARDIAADRTHGRKFSASFALLAGVALLACASAIVVEILVLAQRGLSDLCLGMAWVSGASAFAAGLFVASHALHRLGKD